MIREGEFQCAFDKPIFGLRRMRNDRSAAIMRIAKGQGEGRRRDGYARTSHRVLGNSGLDAHR